MTRRCWMFATVPAICALACLPGASWAQGRDAGAAPAQASSPRADVRPGARAAAPVSPASQRRLGAEYGKLPLAFEANQGQTDGQVKFLSRGAGYTLFLTGGGAVLEFRGQGSGARSQKEVFSRQRSAFSNQPSAFSAGNEPRTAIHDPKTTDYGQRTTDPALALRLIDSNPAAAAAGEDELPGKSNYFIGNDPKKWRTNVANFAKVRYRNVYPGIDLVYYGNQGKLEYDFIVAPGADPSAIKLDVGAVEDSRQSAVGSRQSAVGGRQLAGDGRAEPRVPGPEPRVAANGDLIVKLNGGEVRFNKPVIYQPVGDFPAAGSSLVTRHSSLVNGRYRLRHHQVTFEVAKYDRTRPLVVDPALSYATFIGVVNATANPTFAIAVDSSGNSYVTGGTSSADYLATAGVLQPVYAGDGGTDFNQNANLAGDAFVTKLSPTGSAVLYSTYLGGTAGDQGTGIAVDSSGDAFIAGTTASINFPTTTGAFQTICGDCNPAGDNQGAFITKLDPTGSSLVYSTYLSGSGGEYGGGIALDASGNAYMAGHTWSPDFPVTSGAFQSFCSGSTYVAKLNATGSALVYSTCLGNQLSFTPNPIAVDTLGNAYVAGSAFFDMGSIPTTPGAFQTTFPGGTWDGFVTKLNATGDALVYSTYLGGSTEDEILGLTIDTSGDAHVTGIAYSADFPVTSGAYDTTCRACVYHSADGFVTELNPTGSGLIYSTYLGGSTFDQGNGLALDAAGNAYVTGLASSSDFPTTLGAFQTACAPCGLGGSVAFLTEMNPQGSALVYSTFLSGTPTPPGQEGVMAEGIGIVVDSAGNTYLTGPTFSNTFPTTPGAFETNCSACSTTPDGYENFVAKFVSGDQVWPLALSFPSQDVGASTAQTTTFTNSESTALSITGVTITGATDFTQTNSCGSSLAAGASCTVTVTFTPSLAGARSATLNITDSAENSPQTVALTGSGVGIPMVSPSPTSLAFGNELVGSTSSTQTLTITNPGTGALSITSVVASAGYAETNTCGSSIAAGASCTVSVNFDPTVSGGDAGTITITDNAAGSPQTVALSGTGVAPVVTLAPTSLTFTSQAVGSTSAPQTVTLTNSGTAALTVSSIGGIGDFAVTNNCPNSLAAQSSCLLSVTFTPQSTGTRSGFISLTDSATGSPQSIDLTGTGVPPAGPIVGLSPSSLTFPSQLLGTSSLPETITLTNTGGTALTVTGVTSSSAEYGVLNACGSTVAAGSSCAIGVFFDPAASGSQPATLTITDNATGGHQTVSLSGAGMDFSLTAANSTATTTPGGTVGYSVYVVPVAGFKDAVSLTCSGAPAQSTCTVTPGSIAPGGSSPAAVQVSVTTTSSSGLSPGGSRNPMRLGPAPLGLPPFGLLIRESRANPHAWLWILAFVLLSLLLSPMLAGARGRGARAGIVRLAPAMALLLLALTVATAGCGGGMSSVTPATNAGTPQGSYELTVTGSFKSGATVLVHTVTLKLTVE